MQNREKVMRLPALSPILHSQSSTPIPALADSHYPSLANPSILL